MKQSLLKKMSCLITTSALTFCPLSNASASLHPDAKTVIDVWLSSQLEYQQIPYLSASYVIDQEVVWQGTFGKPDLAQPESATSSSMSSICSTTKIFTATAIMKLVDEGTLNLDDKLTSLLPEFTIQGNKVDEITVLDLLKHTSGLPRDTPHHYWSGPTHDFPNKHQFIESLAKLEQIETSEPKVMYSNIGYALLGQIIEKMTHQRYEDYMQSALFEPLNMNNSVAEMPADKYGKQHVIGYSAINRQAKRTPASFYQTGALKPAIGISSTPADLAKFAMWNFRATNAGTSEIVGASTLSQMFSNEFVDAESKRGLGYIVNSDKQGDTWAMHGGICPGYSSFFKMNISQKRAISFVTSANRVRALAYVNNLNEIVLRAEKIENSPSFDVDLSQYVGLYDLSPLNGDYYIGKWGDDLVMLYFPVGSINHAMHHYRNVGTDTFQRLENGELTQDAIVFKRNSTGKVVSVLNEGGLHKKL